METTIRRTLQQAIHCMEEALSVIEREGIEDIQHAENDLRQANDLLSIVIRRLGKLDSADRAFMASSASRHGSLSAILVLERDF